MCNCSGNFTSLCTRCSTGQTCACPPDYSILPLPVNCGCCPDGYTWSGPTANWPNGVCTGPGGMQTEPVDCTSCVDSVPAECVILPAIGCYNITAGTTLYSFINNYMCSDAFVMSILQKIALSSTLQATLCTIMAGCPPAGGTTPILGPITTTVP